jgi:hypothetical protein
MDAAAEISDLRATEALVQRANERLGRLQNRLMQAHPGNLLVVGYLPLGTCTVLPVGWQSTAELRLVPRLGLVPRDIRGSVAISEEAAERICRAAGE